MTRKIKCNIFTPERVIYEGEADFLVVQAFDGELGFLYNHTPLIAELGFGEARLRTKERADYFAIEGGFVEIRNNELIVLAEAAFRKEDLSREALQKQIAETRGRAAGEEWDLFELEVELKKLKARLKVASR